MWVETRGKEAYGLSVLRRRHDFVRDPIEDASLFVGFGAFAAVGSILMAKRPRNPIGSGDHHDAAGQHCRLAKRRVMTRTSDRPNTFAAESILRVLRSVASDGGGSPATDPIIWRRAAASDVIWRCAAGFRPPRA